ncbi:MAG: SurA N-terminal domain-containing protein, partial [Ferrovibrionaceae bacterium]
MRSAAGTWVARVLMLLLILSFGVWGIGDYIRPKPDTVAASVGKVEISDMAFRDQYRFQLNAMQRQMGGALSPELAKQFGVPDRVLNEMIDQALFDQEAKRLGLNVSDTAVASQIRDMPAFR